MAKRWTKEEIQKLESMYNTATKEELLAAFPDRDYLSILKKASKLGIGKKKERWTEGEIEKLKRMYPYSDMDTLVKELKKTESAIKSKAKQLKLKKDPNYDGRKKNSGRANSWSDYEDAILRLHYPYGGYKKVMEELPARTASAIKNRAKKLGLTHDPNARPIWERIEEDISDIGIKRTVRVVYKKI